MMTKKDNKNRIKIFFCCIVIMCFLLLGSFMYNENILLATEKYTKQDIAKLSEEEKIVVMMLGNLRNSYDKNFNVGDFVRYRLRPEEEDEGLYPESEGEIKVYDKENNAFWIVEREIQERKVTKELHFLIDFKNMKILKAYGLYYGEKRELQMPKITEKEASRICKRSVEEIKRAEESGERMPMPRFEFKKAAKLKKVKVPAGSFNCICLEPIFPAELTGNLSPEEIEEEKNQRTFYFNKDVPRLIPFFYIYNMMDSSDPDILGKVQGGLVKYYTYELIDYSK